MCILCVLEEFTKELKLIKVVAISRLWQFMVTIQQGISAATKAFTMINDH